jgi:TIR domain
MIKQHPYHVAFSFAGEERDYVKEVAGHLRSLGISVFYDSFEQVDLWGKNLYSHLDDIYRNKARYCVMFISKAYREKSWTNLERESAQTRAFEENQDYILPARFDDTEIPGIHPTIGYIDLRSVKPKQLADMIVQKLGLSEALKVRKSRAKIHTSGTQRKTKPTTRVLKPKERKPTDRPTKAGERTNLKISTTKTKTVNFNKEGISRLPNDQPVVYKILTEGGSNNFTGTARRGNVQAKIQEHLIAGSKYVPGSKVQIERFKSIDEAKEKASRIIARTKPKYNS